MWIFIGLTVLLIAVTNWWFNSTYGYWKRKGVPYPSPLPLVGNLGASLILTRSLGQIYTDIYNQFKNYSYVGIYKMQQPGVLIRDLELIKTVTIKEFASFHDNDIEVDETTDPVFAKNPFCLKGQKWKVVRSQVTSAITTGKIKNMFVLMTNVTKDLVKYLNTEPDAVGSNGLEGKELAAKFTTDVVASCAFGLEGNSFTDPNAEFRSMGRKLFQANFWTAFKFIILTICPAMNKVLHLSIMTPEIYNWFTGILQETIKYREKNNIVRNDYLDLMLSLKNKPGEYEFKDIDVIAQAMTFYGDGFETSSVALSFTWYELAKNPHVQEKLRKEIDTVLAKYKDEITYEAIQDMSYLDMVISEVLRKYPPGLALVKLCTKTFTFPPVKSDGTGASITIEPGTPIVIPTYAIHYDPTYYQEPETFDPERFTEEAKNARPKCSYMPFGEGPRQCLGSRFALAQIKAAVVAVIANFEIKGNPKTLPGFEMEPKYIMIEKKGGVWLNFYKRTK